MTPNVGLNLDHHPDEAVAGEWKMARNIVLSAKTGKPINDEGAIVFGADDNVGSICGIIPIDDGHVEFVTNNSTVSRILHVAHDETVTVVIDDALLGFDVDNPIRGVYQRNYAGQLIVSWWEGNGSTANRPRLLNFDCMPFTLDVDKSFLDAADVDMLNLFPVVSLTAIELVKVLDTGGIIESGAYYVYMAYEFKDGSRTHYFIGSNPILIYEGHSSLSFSEIDGSAAGAQSNKSFKILFDNLDQRYAYVSVAIVRKVGGVLSAFLAARLKITDTSLIWVYNGTQFLSELTLAEVLVPNQTYSKIHCGRIDNSQLYVGNMTVDGPPQIQKYINFCKIKWIATTEKDIGTYNGSYKNPSNVYYFKDFRSFGVYAIFLIVHMDNGQKWAYHIPGRDAGTINLAGSGDVQEDDTISSIVGDGASDTDIVLANDSYPNAKYYQIFDTAKADGTMGIWHNLDERYEDLDCNKIIDYSANTENEVGNLAGELVRHHRLPSLKVLNAVLTDVIDSDTGPPLLYDINFTGDFDHEGGPVGIAAGSGVYQFAVGTDNTSGWASVIDNVGAGGENEVLFIKDAKIHVKALFRIEGIDQYAIASLGVVRADGTITYLFHEEEDVGVLGGNHSLFGQTDQVVDMHVGDSLFYQMRYTRNILDGEASVDIAECYLEVYILEPDAINISKNIVGIQLNDLFLPVALREHIIGYELGYAERTAADLVVFGQDVIKYDTNGTFRAHPFDNLLKKTAIHADFIRTYYRFEGSFPFIFLDRTIEDALYDIAEIKYVPTDITYPIDNQHREEVVYGTLGTAIPGVTEAIFEEGYFYDATFLVDFIRVIDNVYLDRYSVKVVRTGFVRTYAQMQAEDYIVYGGDNFHSLYGVIITNNSPEEPLETEYAYARLQNLRQLIYPVESISNIGLRHADVNNFYFPKNSNFDNDYTLVDDETFPIINQTTNGMLYNDDYTSVNNLEPQILVRCPDGCEVIDQVRFSTRVHRSIDTGREEYNPGLRVMLINSYYEMPKDKGEIWNLNFLDRLMLIQHQYELYILDNKDVVVGDGIEVKIGRGDLFTNLPSPVVTDSNGYIGCNSLWASFVCPIGYVVADAAENRGKIFVFNGKQAQEISLIKVEKFIRKYLYAGETDNPFATSGVTGVYDDKHKRLIFGKHLLVVNNEGSLLSGFDNFTLSYSIEHERWLGFHDYTPNIFFSTRNGLYSVFNNVAGQVFIHNVIGRYGFYYHTAEDDDPLPCFIDVIAKTDENSLAAAHVESVVFKTRILSGAKTKYDETITQLMVYTDDQCTGLIDVDASKKLFTRNTGARHNDYVWAFSVVRDRVINRDNAFLNEDGSIIGSNVNINKPFYKSSYIICTFAVIRLQYSNANQRTITFVFADTNKLPPF